MDSTAKGSRSLAHLDLPSVPHSEGWGTVPCLPFMEREGPSNYSEENPFLLVGHSLVAAAPAPEQAAQIQSWFDVSEAPSAVRVPARH